MSNNIFNKYKKTQNMDLDEVNLTDLEEFGAVYESNSYSSKSDLNINDKKIKTLRKKPQNFNFKGFLIIISTSSLFIFGIVFYLISKNLFSNVFNNITTNNNLVLEETKDQNPQTIFSEENTQLTGVLQTVDYDKKMLEITDLASNESFYLTITGHTSLNDKYGKSLSLKEFSLGEIVNFSFNEKDELTSLSQNSNVIEYKYVENVNIDATNKLIKFDNKALKYNDYLKITRDLEEYNIESISPLDSLNITVYNETVYSIKIQKSHGTLIFENKDFISNATVEIDTSIFKPLSEISEINLSEGVHKVVIKENSINTFIKEVNISAYQDTVLDLKEVQIKSGLLLINSNVSNYTLYVNNELVLTNEPLKLPYGAYKIKIEKTGYTSFESEVLINKPQSSLDVTLESIQYAGKLTLTSTPENSEVYVDNIFVGYTPLTYKTTYGNHNILLKKNGYEDFDLKNIYISEIETSFNIILRKNETEESKTTEEVTQSSTNSNKTSTDSSE